VLLERRTILGKLHKTWSDAKNKIKDKDWQKRLKLKEDFGPTLDELESLVDHYKKHWDELTKIAKKLVEANRLLDQTIGSYQGKLGSTGTVFTNPASGSILIKLLGGLKAQKDAVLEQAKAEAAKAYPTVSNI
jgi:hypothetical protein